MWQNLYRSKAGFRGGDWPCAGLLGLASGGCKALHLRCGKTLGGPESRQEPVRKATGFPVRWPGFPSLSGKGRTVVPEAGKPFGRVNLPQGPTVAAVREGRGPSNGGRVEVRERISKGALPRKRATAVGAEGRDKRSVSPSGCPVRPVARYLAPSSPGSGPGPGVRG